MHSPHTRKKKKNKSENYNERIRTKEDEYEPAMHSSTKKGQQPPGLHQDESHQQVEGGDLFPVL